MAQSLINDFLKKHQEASIKEVESMKQHLYSSEEMLNQMKRNHSQSVKGTRETKDSNPSGKK